MMKVTHYTHSKEDEGENPCVWRRVRIFWKAAMKKKMSAVKTIVYFLRRRVGLRVCQWIPLQKSATKLMAICQKKLFPPFSQFLILFWKFLNLRYNGQHISTFLDIRTISLKQYSTDNNCLHNYYITQKSILSTLFYTVGSKQSNSHITKLLSK